MGNQPASHTSELSIKILMDQADSLSLELGLDTFGASVVRRIYAQKRQSHLIKRLRNIEDPQKAYLFLEEVHSANLEILDSFYEHILKAGTHQPHQEPLSKLGTPFPKLSLCKSVPLTKWSEWTPISQTSVNIVDLSKGTDHIPNYEHLKEIGLEAIRSQQVCFVILAGGRNIRYDLSHFKQCQALEELPSKSSLMEILLKKLEALGRLINTQINVYIMVSSREHQQKIQQIHRQCIGISQFLEIRYLPQISYGCLDSEGKLVIDDNNKIYLHPNGTGDFFSLFENPNLTYGLNRFKYYQLIGVSNLLEHCFDCFMLGKLVSQRFPWVTMAVSNHGIQGPAIFLNHARTVQVRDSEEIGSGMDNESLSDFPTECPHIFTNHTILTQELILESISSPSWLQHRKYHCKEKKINHQKPLSAYSSIFTFQRQLTDIFALTPSVAQTSSSGNVAGFQCMESDMDEVKEKGRKGGPPSKGLVVVVGQEYYHPLYRQSDALPGVVKMGRIFKKWLGIEAQQNSKAESMKLKKLISEIDKLEQYSCQLQTLCEIDPLVSLEGENLEPIIQELATIGPNIEYPVYIGPPESHQFVTRQQVNEAVISERKGQRPRE